MSGTVQSEIRYLLRMPGGMLEYETTSPVDAVVAHNSYSSLRRALARPGKNIVFIHFGDTRIEDDDSYTCITHCPKKARRLLVLYRDTDISPLLYNGFQG